MPYHFADQLDTLSLPSDPAYTVTMKRRLSYGDQLHAQEAMVSAEVGAEGTQAQLSYADYQRALILAAIVDWNLDDESGQKLPLDLDSVDRLDAADGAFLAAEAAQRCGIRPLEEADPFGKLSSRRSRASRSRTASQNGA